jgi:hypothetical protein
VTEHLLVKDYNNDILKSNNHVRLDIFHELLKGLVQSFKLSKMSHYSLHLPIILK